MRIILFILLVVCTVNTRAQSFSNGNIVVVRIGTGTLPMTTGVAQPVFLDEYSPCGELVQSIAMPTSVNGSHRRLTLPSTSVDFSEGFMSLSEDGQYLALGGYDAATGTTGVTASNSTTVNRVVAVVDAAGSVNTTTAFSNRFSTVSIRSAVVNGSNVWATGGNGGIVYATLGSTGTSNTLITTSTGRCPAIYDGQLYSSSTATGFRLARVGTGLPTATGTTMQNLTGYPSSGGSPFQFFMTRLNGSDTVNVLYVADNNVLKKYSLVSGTWTDNGTIGVLGDKFRGITGVEADGIVTLYAVRRNDIGGELVRYIDSTGHNASFSNLKPVIIAQADTNKVFRSVAMAPQALAMAKKAATANDNTSFRVLSNNKGPVVVAEITAARSLHGVVQVCDLNGRILYTRKVTTEKGMNRFPLDMPANARGLFMATFITGQGHLLTNKFIY